MGSNWSANRGVKRPYDDVEAASETSTDDASDSSDLHTPKRKRFQSTSQYIVKKLFEEGTDSDVTIQALGKSWLLHKIYLSQCKYFDSMFSGQWAESAQSNIRIEISDENIDLEALKIAFKSLYTDHILVKPIEAVGVLAAATFLQLDPLIEHCRTVMKGCITRKTVCSYVAASEHYGLFDVKKQCMTWLLHCFMLPQTTPILTEICEDLLMSLLDSKDLWLMQVEVDIYCLLKKWMFTQLNPVWSGDTEQLYSDCTDFFKRRAQDNDCCFLETEEGHRFIHMFEKVRWMYLINDSSGIQTVKDDRIVPENWLDPVFKFCWTHHLKAEQGVDIGPRDVNEEDFYKWSMRCGRLLMHEQDYHWRWLGYSYGLDLLFTLRHRVLTVSRNIGITQHFPGSLSQQETRHVMLCVRVTQMKKNFTVKSSGIQTLSLRNDDVDVNVLTLEPGIKFPMQVTMHLLYLNPDISQPYPSLYTPPPPLTVVPCRPPAPTTPSSTSDAKNALGSGQGEGGGHGSGSHGQSEKTESGGDEGDDCLKGMDVATQTEEPAVAQTENSVPGCGSSELKVLKDAYLPQTASECSLESHLSSSLSKVSKNIEPGHSSADGPRISNSSTASGSSSSASNILTCAESFARSQLPSMAPSSSSSIADTGSSVTLQSSSSAFVNLPTLTTTPPFSAVPSSQSLTTAERKKGRRSTRMRSGSRNCMK